MDPLAGNSYASVNWAWKRIVGVEGKEYTIWRKKDLGIRR